jgi:hypothetical protein
VKAIGQFDEDYADVGRHGKDHLPYIFGLALLTIHKVHFPYLCNAVHDIGSFFAKQIPDFIQFGIRIFDSIMQQSGCNADRIHFELGKNMSGFQGMGKIGLA